MSGRQGLWTVALLLACGTAVLATGCAAPMDGPSSAAAGIVDPAKLTSAAAEERVEAEMAVLAAGVQAVPALADLAAGDDPAVQAAAMRLLAKLAQQDPAVAPACLEALVSGFLSGGPAGADAAMALRGMGRPAVEALADALRRMPPAAAEGAPAWHRPLALMLQIDRRAALEALVSRLGDEPGGAARGNFTLMLALGAATQETFGYDPRASTQRRQAAVERARSWWEVAKALPQD